MASEYKSKDTRKIEILDGNEAAAWVAAAFTEVAAVYPITPSTEMSEKLDKFVYQNKQNIFKSNIIFVEANSEIGVAGIIHGALTSGSLATSFTCSQGLLLFIPVLYRLAGECLPAVIYVSTRSIATHALSIFGDHSDIYACRQTGVCMICASSVQEIMDLSLVVHLSAVTCSMPFIFFFDGFRTSHELRNVKTWSYCDFEEILDSEFFLNLDRFKSSSVNPSRDIIRGTNQNDDIFFQVMESKNYKYDTIINTINSFMLKINKKIGTNYMPFNYYGHTYAEKIIIAMGSVCQTIQEVVDYLNKKNQRVGLIIVHVYRPFSIESLISVLPKTVSKISILDRTKESGSVGEPLYLDIIASFNQKNIKNIIFFAGRYGIASKDTSYQDILAVFENMNSDNPKKQFTIGILDDITNLSLEPIRKNVDFDKINNHFEIQIWGLGSDGSISSAKNIIKIIAENTKFNVQGYFKYDSKKAGGLTVSHVRFNENLIKSEYYVKQTDILVCQHFEFVNIYDYTEILKPGSVFLLNSSAENINKINSKLIDFILKNDINFFILDSDSIAEKFNLNGKINTSMETAFFKIISDYSNLLIKKIDFISLIKINIAKNYSHKGEILVNNNIKAVDFSLEKCNLITKINLSLSLSLNKKIDNIHSFGFEKIVNLVNSNKGDTLPVSSFLEFSDGTVPNNTACLLYKKKCTKMPFWGPENCIQCGICSLLCPHGVIKSIALTYTESVELYENFGIKCINFSGFDDLNFAIIINYNQCTGCGICAKVCPGKFRNNALIMQVSEKFNKKNHDIYIFLDKLSKKDKIFEKFKPSTVRGVQFKEFLLQFGDACPGCGQPAYARLVTQLFGMRLCIANATGCSSIWGGSVFSIPYKRGTHGFSPAWHSSLFENNAEFGFGMALSHKNMRNKLLNFVKNILNITKNKNLKIICQNYVDSFDNGEKNFEFSSGLINILKKYIIKIPESSELSICTEILKYSEYLSKKSVWIFGGDGWAYDIGFAGLDHVIASGENVNILVFDTEMYSNTGGQCSKATSCNTNIKFALGGKKTSKKKLADMIMLYQKVYVAQVNIAANPQQCVNAFVEAEAYNGPSLIIAYASCVGHGIKNGMSNACEQAINAVKYGYWNLFRFNPDLNSHDKLVYDSYNSCGNIDKFINNEQRFKI
ncbi:MAG: pyruvate:ferredoxin (flavodoxin) oxidoreductase [Candidatus Improbicoccus devescovinae]|nr:MAG: pyruvate:ferredoxin (flavodoxin) oxidoreductase [Candidatus Improbicoccus devescovinae]